MFILNTSELKVKIVHGMTQDETWQIFIIFTEKEIVDKYISNHNTHNRMLD